MLTIDDVCARLKVHRVTLYRLIQRGEFPPPTKRIGNRPRWREDVVKNWETA